MAAMINGINQYYRTYAMNQTGNSTYNPMAELLKIGSANAVYSQNYVKEYDPKLSDYFNSLTKNTYLLKGTTGAMQTTSMQSSLNKKAVTIGSAESGVIGTATNRAELKNYSIHVTNLAEKQTNTGDKLASADAATNVGINTFSIGIGSGVAKSMSFVVEQGDTNKVALTKMANAISLSGTGLKATVVEDAKSGTSSLQVEGRIGAKNGFTFADVKGTAVSTTGAGTVSNTAKNGELTVDGKKYSTEDNSVKLNNGNVTLIVNKAEGKDIKVSVGADTGAAMKGIKELVSSYNSMIEFATRYSTELSGAASLKGELGSIVQAKKTSLDAIGITMNKDNSLVIDEKKLADSLQNEFTKVRELVGGRNGIADRLERKTDEILINQYKYAEPKQLSPTYTDTSNYFTPSGKMPYLQNLNLGYFLNYTV